jgi:SAM-dependent methyltransferase
MTAGKQVFYQRDLDDTEVNRSRLRQNRNLMLWYQELYKEMFRAIPDVSERRVLEIGSGASPLKSFLPNVITTDVLNLAHLDLVFDCHEIAELPDIPDKSIDVITLTNVLHHLRDPILFLNSATRKLVAGGQLLIAEPYFSALSYPLYRCLHHEPVDFRVARPVLGAIDGPLSTSNQAIPYLIFFSRRDWRDELSENYDLDKTRIGYYTSLAYMVTGGISRVFPVPYWLFRPYLGIDRQLARLLPRVFASFFTVTLVAKGGA